MHRTRQHLLAQTGNLMFVEEPPAPEGGSDGDTPPEGASDETPKEEEGDGEAGNDFATLPEWAQTEIKNLRRGEAKYRTTAAQLRDQLQEAKSQDDIDAAVKQYQERNSELEVELAIAKHTVGFTPEQLALVDGKTAEEVEEKANKVRAALAATQGGDPGMPQNPNADGGRRPGSQSLDGLSPRERAEALRARRGRRR